jgi:hypothetical protein
VLRERPLEKQKSGMPDAVANRKKIQISVDQQGHKVYQIAC